MNDLISRQDIKEKLNELCDKMCPYNEPTKAIGACCSSCAIDDVIEIVQNLPSAERTGKWIRTAGEYIGDDVSGFYDYHWACSECEREAIINDWNIYELSDYCPNCGADMRGEQDEHID